MTKPCFFLILFILLISFSSTCVATHPVNRDPIISTFIHHYNNHNFDSISFCFPWWLRKLVNTDQLTQPIKGMHNEWGDVIRYEVVKKEKKKVLCNFFFRRDTTQPQQVSFIFSSGSKIIGVGTKSTKFVFPDRDIKSLARYKGKLDSLLNYKNSFGRFNGCFLVVYGQESYFNCIGTTENTVLSDSSIFELASCSKQFTATAILQLVDSGRIKLQDFVQQYLPDFPYPEVQIKHLLNHSAGLPDYMELFDRYWDKTKFATNNDVILMLKAHKPKLLFVPGKGFSYSNTGYAVLSLVIESVSGSSYKEFIAENIFNKLGMKNSLVYNNRRFEKFKIKNVAVGYTYLGSCDKFFFPDSLEEYDYLRYLDRITGDGTINSSIKDLELWVKNLFDNKLVSDSLWKVATQCKAIQSNYGFGMMVEDNEGSLKLIFHGGTWGGYKSMILAAPEKKLGVVVLSNNSYPYIEQLTSAILTSLLD